MNGTVSVEVGGKESDVAFSCLVRRGRVAISSLVPVGKGMTSLSMQFSPAHARELAAALLRSADELETSEDLPVYSCVRITRESNLPPPTAESVPVKGFIQASGA